MRLTTNRRNALLGLAVALGLALVASPSEAGCHRRASGCGAPARQGFLGGMRHRGHRQQAVSCAPCAGVPVAYQAPASYYPASETYPIAPTNPSAQAMSSEQGTTGSAPQSGQDALGVGEAPPAPEVPTAPPAPAVPTTPAAPPAP